MIKLADSKNKNLQSYIKCPRDNPYYVRICSLFSAYDSYPDLCSFYVQTNTKEELTAVFVNNGGSMTADILTNDCNLLEITQFAPVVSRSFLCSGDYNISFNKGLSSCGAVMKYKAVANKCTHTVKDNVHPREYYDLLKLCESDTFVVPPFNSFYTDISHRLRHNSAKLFGIYIGKILVSGCVLYTTKNSSGTVLSGVCTIPQFSHMGYGTPLVSYVSNSIWTQGNNIYLQRYDDTYKKFYENTGYTDYGVWQEHIFSFILEGKN